MTCIRLAETGPWGLLNIEEVREINRLSIVDELQAITAAGVPALAAVPLARLRVRVTPWRPTFPPRLRANGGSTKV